MIKIMENAMNTEKIREAIDRKFKMAPPDCGNRHIVFWYDEKGEFSMWVDSLLPEGVKLLRLDNNYFDIRQTLEKTDLTSHYLIYSDKPRPDFRENWLLDIELYSNSFSADRASIILNDFKIENLGLKDVIRVNIAFFDNKERVAALQALNAPLKTERDIQLAMMAVICKCRTMSIEPIIRTLLIEDLNQTDNKLYEQLIKYPGEGVFWSCVKDYCGYSSDSPTLKELFQSLLLTTTAALLRLHKDTGWGKYILTRKNNAHVFIDHWMNHKEHAEKFDELSSRAFAELELKNQMEGWKPEECLEADTFEVFDKIIIQGIVQGILTDLEDFETWRGWINRRKSAHWYANFQDYYLALDAAVELLVFKKRHEGKIAQLSPAEMMNLYAKEYFRADQLYRTFCSHLEQVSADILRGLADKIERLYVNWFQETLAQNWQEVVSRDLMGNWCIPGVCQQKDFYRRFVTPILQKNDREKVFVIISDGLRYEAAQELAIGLEQETRSEPAIEYVQGSVPSYTALGMAALLPNEQIRMKTDGKIQVDGMDVISSDNREKILKGAFEQSMVITLKALMDMSKEEAREPLRENRVIYIYHNTIDNIADKQATEHKTFEAVADTIDEIKRCVKKIVNSLNGTHVLITADHGFLYQREGLTESDKISSEGGDAVASGRRFILAKSGKSLPGTTEISMKYILGKDSALAAYVPKGNIRFKCSGGMKYVHGGASLQEIVVPVIRHTHIRKESKRAQETTKVDVELTNTTRKIPNNPFVFHFYQTEKVSTKRLPRTLRVAVWDLKDKETKVSTEELLLADRDSDRAEDRTFTVRLKLKGGIGIGEYFLRLVDNETGLEYKRVPFQVSLGIPTIDDF